MTTYNAMPYVREALDSILAQTLRDFELIVVDDGSTDGTVEAVRAAADDRVRLLQVPRCGRIPALNLGFQEARAPFVANQDADDVSAPDRLEVSVKALEDNPEWAMVGAAICPLVDSEDRTLGERRYPTSPDELRRELGRRAPFFHSSCLYRREAWLEAGGFDESLPVLEDYDLWVRLAARHPLANLPRALGVRRRHRGQTFDARHWTRKGYRTRARIVWRYVRRVRRSPVAAARALAYLGMNARLRLAWLRITRADPGEVEFWR